MSARDHLSKQQWPGEEWREARSPEEQDMLSRWEVSPKDIAPEERRAFRRTISTAPELEGPVYRGDRVMQGQGWVMPLNKQVEHFQGMMERGEPVNISRHASTSAKPEIAAGFGRTLYEIHDAGARAIGNSLHEGIMPPGKFHVTGVEHSPEQETRSAVDGRTIYNSPGVRVRLKRIPKNNSQED